MMVEQNESEFKKAFIDAAPLICYPLVLAHKYYITIRRFRSQHFGLFCSCISDKENNSFTTLEPVQF